MPNALQDIRVLQTPTFKSNDRGLMIFVLRFFRCGVYSCDLLKVFPMISEMLISTKTKRLELLTTYIIHAIFFNIQKLVQIFLAPQIKDFVHLKDASFKSL